MLRLVGTKIKASPFLASSTATLIASSILYQQNQQKQVPTYNLSNANTIQCGDSGAYLNDTTLKSYNTENNDNEKQSLEKEESNKDVINEGDKTLQKYCQTLVSNILFTERIIPTIEALGRAIRLVQTITLIIIDYEMDKHSQFIDSISPNYLKNFIANNKEIENKSSNDNKTNNQIEYWENEIAKRTKDLENAQYEYTKDPSDEIQMLKNENKSDEDISEYRRRVQKERKEAVRNAAMSLGEAEDELTLIGENKRSKLHQKAANRILELCHKNKGVYIKVGQHLAQLDYLIPPEYIDVLSSLFDNAPVSSYREVRDLVYEELGAYPEDLFDGFSKDPIASASLAQVHVAYDKKTGKKLALKVQHPGLRETSVGDIVTLTYAVSIVETLFEEFSWGWLVDEIAPQLHRELDFVNEGKNAENCSNQFQKSGLECIVPDIQWKYTTSRVLGMNFEEGFKANDVTSIQKSGLKTSDVAKLISSVFQYQVFITGFVHCDPHPANVLLREHPTRKGKPQIVLVDHGLYKQLDDEFRLNYALLWKSIMMADIKGIEESCKSFGIGEMYPLLAAMLTSRPFDEILERSKSQKALLQQQKTKSYLKKGDKVMIRGYVQRYIKEIISMLDIVPRQMLLLFKMNDCLRHIHKDLRSSPMNHLVVAGDFASRALFENSRVNKDVGRIDNFYGWMSFMRVYFKIRINQFILWSLQLFNFPLLLK